MQNRNEEAELKKARNEEGRVGGSCDEADRLALECSRLADKQSDRASVRLENSHERAVGSLAVESHSHGRAVGFSAVESHLGEHVTESLEVESHSGESVTESRAVESRLGGRMTESRAIESCLGERATDSCTVEQRSCDYVAVPVKSESRVVSNLRFRSRKRGIELSADDVRSNEFAASRARMTRGIWTVLGFVSFALGAIGAVLPVFPTVPFLLAAAFCFARSSGRLNAWFRSTALYRKVLEGYVSRRAMTARAKLTLLVPVTAVLGISFLLMENVPVGRAIVAAVWAAHIVYFGFVVKTAPSNSAEARTTTRQTVANANSANLELGREVAASNQGALASSLIVEGHAGFHPCVTTEAESGR